MPSSAQYHLPTATARLIVSYTDPVRSFIISLRTVEPTGSSCYSLPDNENIAAHYNDFHHRNLVYVPANACLLLFAIVVNAAAAKVLYQKYIFKFWIFKIGRYMASWGLFAHLSRPWSIGWVALSFLFVRSLSVPLWWHPSKSHF